MGTVRFFDILKKSVIVVVLFCVVLLLYKFVNNDSKVITCQNNDTEKRFEAIQQPVRQQYNISNTNIYSRSNYQIVSTNPLKYTVQKRQPANEKKKYQDKPRKDHHRQQTYTLRRLNERVNQKHRRQ